MKYCEPGKEGPFDEVIEQNGREFWVWRWLGIKVVVDADSLMYLLGTKIDYKEDDISAEFVFDNPLVSFVFDYLHRPYQPVVVERVSLWNTMFV